MSNVASELKKAFESAESVEEILKVFKEMESCSQESELGWECFVVADNILREGNDFEQVLSFGNRSLKTLTYKYERTKLGSRLLIADVLRVLGSAFFELKRFDESLGSFNCADKVLSMIKSKDRTVFVVDMELRIQEQLHTVKSVMGMRVEAVVHKKKILEIKEKIMEEGSVELGEAYNDLSRAYIEAYDLESALPFCLKALDIYTKQLGPNSVEVGQLKRNLAVIYHEMGQTKKALLLTQAAVCILKGTGSLDLQVAITEGANMFIDLGKYEEAVVVMKGVVSRVHDGIGGRAHVRILNVMARALCYSGKFADAEEYINIAQRKLEEKEADSMFAAVGYADMSSLYQMMNNVEAAISLLKKGLALAKLPGKLLAQFCPRLMSLIFKSGEEKREVSYMKGVVENLKESFGPNHCVVGYGYTNLGLAYMRSGQYELSAKSLANAKDILDVNLGPHHLTSLKTSHGLSVAYAALGRHYQALEIVEKVVEGLKGLEPSELQLMQEAVKHLSNMKERVADSPPKMNEDLRAAISQCVISDDGKGT